MQRLAYRNNGGRKGRLAERGNNASPERMVRCLHGNNELSDNGSIVSTRRPAIELLGRVVSLHEQGAPIMLRREYIHHKNHRKNALFIPPHACRPPTIPE